MTEIIILVILIIVIIILNVCIPRKKSDNNNNPIITEDNYEFYSTPRVKNLTPEQIEDIHSRGKITPSEKVKEWESLDLCAPGDAIGSAAWRCKKFRNYHDCLVDYANEFDEHTSFFKNLNPVKIKIFNSNEKDTE